MPCAVFHDDLRDIAIAGRRASDDAGGSLPVAAGPAARRKPLRAVGGRVLGRSAALLNSLRWRRCASARSCARKRCPFMFQGWTWAGSCASGSGRRGLSPLTSVGLNEEGGDLASQTFEPFGLFEPLLCCCTATVLRSGAGPSSVDCLISSLPALVAEVVRLPTRRRRKSHDFRYKHCGGGTLCAAINCTDHCLQRTASRTPWF